MTPSAPERPSAIDDGPGDAPDFTEDSFPADPALQCDIVMKGGITSGVVYPLAVCELATTYRLRSVGGASAGAIAAAAAAAAEVGRRSTLPANPGPANPGPANPGPANPGPANPGPANPGPANPGPANPGPATTASATDAPPRTAPPPTNPPTSPPTDALPRGFLGLAAFPELLGRTQPDGRSLLFHLFRPQPEARRLFALLSAVLEQKTRLPEQPTRGHTAWAVLAVIGHATTKAPIRSLLGVGPGLVLLVLGILALARRPVDAGSVVAALVLAVVVGVLATALGLLIALVTGVLADLARLPSVGFGMSSGRGADDGELALTPWLYRRLQELAGRPYDRPLTFGDLEADGLRLQMMTTNLSRSQPMTMPWDDDVYFFEPAELEKLFGPVVVQAMVDHPPPLPTAPAARRVRETLLAHAGTKRPFPRAADLPIIVATRMSLSFPLLISAVPLYALDYSGRNLAYLGAVREWRREHPGAGLAEHVAAVSARPVFDVNWFSDGGLTSNLPVHFFDTVLPSRPTFAIDLAPFDDDHPRSADERANSHLPVANSGPGHRRTLRWSTRPLPALFSFGLALFQTARSWVDQAALIMPGYRDRVVTVYQDGAEGGVNLAMPPELVTALSRRGRFAAARLVDRFGHGGEGWPNHQWIRFRTSTAALSDWLADFERGYTVRTPSFYDPLLGDDAQHLSYPISGDDLVAVRERITGLRAEIEDWAAEPADAFTANRPQPPPILRLAPRTDGGA